MPQKQRVERAEVAGQIFETDKFYTKKAFVFRAPEPLKGPNKRFQLAANTDFERISESLVNQPRLDNGCFDASMMAKPDLHRITPASKTFN